MSRFITDTRTFCGPTQVAASAWVGFVAGQRYHLRYERLPHGMIYIESIFNQLRFRGLVLTEVEFDLYWQKH